MGHWYDSPWFRAPAAIATGGASEVARGYFTAGDPYKDAAAGARDIAEQDKQFSQDQWNRQMQGLQGALNSYGPSTSYWYNNIGNSGPGAAENFYSQNQSQWQQPTAQQGAYGNYQSWMNDPWNNQTRQGATQANQYLAGNTAANDAYYQMRGQLGNYSGPQNGAAQYAADRSQFNSPGSAESYYTQNQNRYNTGGDAKSVYDNFSQQLYGPSQSEQFKVTQPTYGQDTLAANLGWANGATAGQQNEGENKGYIRGANDISNYFQSQQGALSGPGQYEQFVTQDINGTNPAYQREKAQGIAQINQEMARRGGFNSGAALTSIGNYTGALDAADYQNRANRAQQAQQMQLARIGQGTQTAGASSGNQLAQGQALQGIDNANEAAQLGRKSFGLAATQQASNESLAGQQLALQAAGQGDSQKLARLQGLQSMGSAADQGNLAYLNAGQNAANNAQSQQLARLMGGMTASNQVDQTQLASDQQQLQRLLGSYNMAQGADASNLARAQQLFNQGQGLDQSMLQRFGLQQNMAQGVDAQKLANYLGQGNMANNAQSAEQQRMQQAFADMLGINNAQAGQYGNFYGQGGQLSGAAFSDAMNALANAYGLQAQGEAAPNEYLMRLLGMGAQIGGAAAGRRG